MGIIYMYTAPCGKKYIGQTIQDPKARAKKNGKGYLGCLAFYQAILHYGFENFSFEVLEENIPKEQLNDREAYYIQKFNTLVPNGYNMTKGDSHSSDVLKKRVYQFSLDKILLNEYESLSEASRKTGIDLTCISEVINGKKATCGNYYWSLQKEGNVFKTPKQKRVYMFDEEGNFIKSFESSVSADRFFKLSKGTVRQCANKNQGRKRINGYIFTYDPYVDWNYYAFQKTGPKSKGSTTKSK